MICQLVGLDALRARVPAALKRTVDGLFRALEEVAEELGGERVRSPAVGVLTVWRSVDDAANFAVRLQREILERDWPTTLLLRPEAAEWRAPDGTLLYRGPRVRTAVHHGRIDRVPRDDGRDVIGGPAVYQLARLVATLHGGQTVVSHEAWSRMQVPPPDAVITDLGFHRLIGVHSASQLRQLVPDELAQREFPPPTTRDVARTNAPNARTGFIGRDGDLQALSELAGFGLRVVTVTGTPGVGKSSLLTRYVGVHADTYTTAGSGGAWVCRVEGRTPAHVIVAVAFTLGLTLRFGRNRTELLRQVGAVLRRRGPTLIAVDGVLADPESLRECLHDWLQAAPELRLLVATSKRLGLPGEITYQLEAFPPAAAEGARNADAVRHFVSRALRSAPRFQPTDPAQLATLVNLLGGNPLAIALVAGLAGRLSLDRIVAEVQALEAGDIDGVVELVWRHLDDADRHVLSACSVYPAGFDRLGAEAVVDPEETGIDPADALQRLLRGGLVLKTEDARTPEVRRFMVDGRVRQRAQAELSAEQRRTLERRAAQRVLGQCEPWSARAWGSDGIEVMARLAVEWASLAGIAMRAARDTAEPEDVDLGLRACAALWPLVATQGPAGLFLELVSPVLERADVVLGADPVLQVAAMVARAGARRNIGDLAGAMADAERGMEVAKRWGDEVGEGHSAMMGGLVQHARGNFDRSSELLERAVELLDQAQVGYAAVARGALAVVRLEFGDFERAESLLLLASETLHELGWRRYLGMQLTGLGLLHRRCGRLDQAQELYTEAAALHRALGDRRSLAICLVNLASLELRQERLAEARQTLDEALLAAQETGDRVAESRVHGNQALAALALDDIGLAREHLLAAMAIDRDLRDRAAEALDTAYLGVAHHLGGHIQGARDSYVRALRVLEDKAPPRVFAHVYAWLGALEAEEHDREAARQNLDRARELAGKTGEPSVIATVDVLEGVWHLLDADGDAAAVGRARAAYDAAEGSQDIDVRIARRRLGHLLEHGLTTG